jgi:glycosyltransferase involved in cell wall biosynthesis
VNLPSQPSADPAASAGKPKLLFLVTEDWYFVSHRFELAVAALRAGYEVSVATRAGRYSSRITTAGLTLYPVDFNRSGLNPIQEIAMLVRIAAIYRRVSPDIVHHVALKPVIYGSLIARVLRSKAIVNALGGLGYVFSSKEIRAKLLRPIVRRLLKLALGGAQSRLIVQNRQDREQVVAGGLIADERVRLIRGAGVDPAAYLPTVVASEVPLAILPARLLWDKGVGEFQEAARRLRAKGVRARFALVGEPDAANPASVSQSDIDAWSQEGVIEYWGWKDDMRSVYAQAQIVCLPSYHEGLPKSLLEAGASGCAIVTTDIPGCREIVEEGKSGWLVPARDVEALAKALQEAIEQPALRQRYGEAVRDLVATDFSTERVVTETIAIYHELLGHSEKRG